MVDAQPERDNPAEEQQTTEVGSRFDHLVARDLSNYPQAVKEYCENVISRRTKAALTKCPRCSGANGSPGR
jgi:hypothetical protein